MKPVNARVPIDVASVVNARPLSSYQLGILSLLGLTVVVDGFDVQAMGYVAPSIIQEWGVAKPALGPVFGAGLLGMLVGSLALSLLSDRLGRRPVLIAATFFFAFCMLATAGVESISALLWVRFLTGVGLGAIMPNAIALAGEFSPQRRKVTLMMLVSCGFTIGAVLGGVISALLIPLWGWQSVFIIGGIAPLLLGILMSLYLPESMEFLVLRGLKPERVAASIRRIAPDLDITSDSRFAVADTAQRSGSVMQLFRNGQARTTLLLWAVNFMNLLNLYFLSSWLPTVFRDVGLETSTAVIVGTMLQLGGVTGTLLMGPLIDRIGFAKVLIPSFALATVTIALIGQTSLPLAALFMVVTITGMCVIGGQPAVNALAASYYPTSIRSTGIGWSLGVGRIGSIAGPVIGGQLIGYGWETSSLFIAAAMPAALSALFLILMQLRVVRQQRPSGIEKTGHTMRD
ncbi:MFS transporter [Metapseudomonas otitidis]|uniref:MFS transporter n=1 Tax=Metapseudomonas otitidis TaxID=319939 RepID=UPI0013F687CC|nr:MFS transporter [Pseudomonas otitidis]